MEVHRELVVEVPPEQRSEFIESLEQELPEGWSREPEAEGRLARIAPGSVSYYTFACPPSGDRPPAIVTAGAVRDGPVEIFNIVPTEGSSLSVSQYNDILVEFSGAVSKIAGDEGYPCRISDDQQDLEDWMSPETASLLRNFSSAANKATGSAHSLDKERWNAFLISLHREGGGRLGTDRLGDWLQAQGWSSKVALELVIEFEKAIDLLKQYDGT